MSLRRVDDDAALAPSIDAVRGALADRLPVATRLNHVLTIGARFRMEQQGKSQQQPQPRKPVSTNAYPRAGSYRPDPANRPYDWESYSRWGKTLMGTCNFKPTPLFTQQFDAYVAAMNAFEANPGIPNLQWDAIRATIVLGSISNTFQKLDYLREKDCYVVLNFMANAYNPNTVSHQGAFFMMRESLHHDKFDLAPAAGITSQNIANLVTNQCALANMHLAPLNGNFAYNAANYPGFADPVRTQKEMDWQVCQQDILAAEGAGETEAALAAAAAAAAAAAQAAAGQPAMQPQYQQMPGGGAFHTWGNQ